MGSRNHSALLPGHHGVVRLESRQAGLGALYEVVEEHDPVECFRIEPEEYVDIEKLAREYFAADYGNK
jgi:hypothetical protein